MMRRSRSIGLCIAVLAIAFAPLRVSALPENPLAPLQSQLSTLTMHAPGRVGIAVEDLATGLRSGVNASANLPAASTIKIPVMIEVFRQFEGGNIDLNTVVHLEQRDRDWGWGDMADAPRGTSRTVKQLLWLMITQSDNTATNMLIRLVGRANINATMARLGMRDTHLGNDIRSETESIRYALRTSPSDMVAMLDKIARERMIDGWSSRQMLAILSGQTHNGLIPMTLPAGVRIAHKTGSLHDTLNDVGIVYENGEPYVIAVMTTQLPALDLGRAFIHRVSSIAYEGFGRLAAWRAGAGIAAFSAARPTLADAPQPQDAIPSPDLTMWGANDAQPAALPVVDAPAADAP